MFSSVFLCSKKKENEDMCVLLTENTEILFIFQLFITLLFCRIPGIFPFSSSKIQHNYYYVILEVLLNGRGFTVGIPRNENELRIHTSQ